jgi:hypothetical protein
MKPITPAKRRLVVALAVAVKNYARLQKKAEVPPNKTLWEYHLTRWDYQKKAVFSVYSAAVHKGKCETIVPVLREAGLNEVKALFRLHRLQNAFIRAAIDILKRGGYWQHDAPSMIMEDTADDAI